MIKAIPMPLLADNEVILMKINSSRTLKKDDVVTKCHGPDQISKYQSKGIGAIQ
jgi:hypothetical protein